MNSETIINNPEMALLLVMIAIVVSGLWRSVPVPTFLATVSWNG